MAAGFWPLAAGCWLLASCRWQLAFGVASGIILVNKMKPQKDHMVAAKGPDASCQKQEARCQPPDASCQKPDARDRPFIVPVFLPHAGCPHRCVFCNQSSITGVNCTSSQLNIRSTIETFLKYKGAQRDIVQIAFFGGNFLGLNPAETRRLLAVAAQFVKDGRVDGIRFSTRPDTIDRRRLDLIRNFPVSTIELGVQSMDDRVLAITKRGHTSSDTEKAVEQLKKFNYEVGLQLMVGLPGDDPQRSLASARRIAALQPHFVRIYPTIVVAGSPLANSYARGHYAPLSLEDAVAQVKNLYLLFKSKNIEVIRMGLQASKDLENGSTILAGPYHPAFGHLVYSEIFLDMAVEQIESTALNADSISIRIHPRNVSKLRGLRNRNIKNLKGKFDFKSVEVRPDDSLQEDQLKVAQKSS
jgi:histone acetyltransferase (RNA polymerase elongator complex component)